MKRFIMLMVSSVLAFFLVACGESPAEKNDEDRAKAAMEQQKDMKSNGSADEKKDMNDESGDKSDGKKDDSGDKMMELEKPADSSSEGDSSQ